MDGIEASLMDKINLSAIGKDNPRIQLFLSYCRKDSEMGHWIAVLLKNLNYNVWSASERILP